MIRKVMMPLLLFCFLFVSAPADERDPLLTVDELLRLEPAYKQFLDDLCELLIEKGLLDRGEKEEWITMQLGDYLSNGGYGSILTSFYPGVLAYARDEERICEPKVPLEEGVVSLLTMRRYSPLDTIADGLMLQLGMNGTDGVPLEVRFLLSGTDGVFYRFDALAGGYISAGSAVDVEGETVYWVLPVPVEGQVAPVLQIDVTETESGRFLGRLMMELEIEKNSYVVSEERFRTAAVDEGRKADTGEDGTNDTGPEANGMPERSTPEPAEDPNG